MIIPKAVTNVKLGKKPGGGEWRKNRTRGCKEDREENDVNMDAKWGWEGSGVRE